MVMDHESAFITALRAVGVNPSEADEEKLADAETFGITYQNIWRHPEAHPVVLDFALLHKYGPEWMTWEAETLQLRIPQDFNTQTLSDLNLSKVQACKALHFVDTFWQQWEIFTWCSMPFNGVFPDFEVMQKPTVAQAAVAVDIANRLRADVEFSLEMRTFLGVLHRHDGILVPVPPLDFVAVETSDIDANLADVRTRWPKVKSSGTAPKGDTIEDEQLRRMLHVTQYVEESQKQLLRQLRLLPHA